MLLQSIVISAKHANIETVFCATVNINRNLVVVLTPMKDASKEELRVAAQLVSKAVDAHVEFTPSKTNPTPPNSSLQANFPCCSSCSLWLTSKDHTSDTPASNIQHQHFPQQPRWRCPNKESQFYTRTHTERRWWSPLLMLGVCAPLVVLIDVFLLITSACFLSGFVTWFVAVVLHCYSLFGLFVDLKFVQIIHKRVLLCPASATEEKRHWGHKF